MLCLPPCRRGNQIALSMLSLLQAANTVVITIDAVVQQVVGALLTANWGGKTTRVSGRRTVRRSPWPNANPGWGVCRIQMEMWNVCFRRPLIPKLSLCSRARSSWQRYPSRSFAFSFAEGVMVVNAPAQKTVFPNKLSSLRFWWCYQAKLLTQAVIDFSQLIFQSPVSLPGTRPQTAYPKRMYV